MPGDEGDAGGGGGRGGIFFRGWEMEVGLKKIYFVREVWIIQRSKQY